MLSVGDELDYLAARLLQELGCRPDDNNGDDMDCGGTRTAAASNGLETEEDSSSRLIKREDKKLLAVGFYCNRRFVGSEISLRLVMETFEGARRASSCSKVVGVSLLSSS